jgi:hypothetical protein
LALTSFALPSISIKKQGERMHSLKALPTSSRTHENQVDREVLELINDGFDWIRYTDSNGKISVNGKLI